MTFKKGHKLRPTKEAIRKTVETKRKKYKVWPGSKDFWKGKKLSKEHIEKAVKNRGDISGKDNPNWKGGISYNWAKKMGRLYLKKECKKCGSTKKLVVHHKNKKVNDNRLDNLMILCGACHLSLHHKGRRAWNKGLTKKEKA